MRRTTAQIKIRMSPFHLHEVIFCFHYSFFLISFFSLFSSIPYFPLLYCHTLTLIPARRVCSEMYCFSQFLLLFLTFFSLPFLSFLPSFLTYFPQRLTPTSACSEMYCFSLPFFLSFFLSSFLSFPFFLLYHSQGANAHGRLLGDVLLTILSFPFFFPFFLSFLSFLSFFLSFLPFLSTFFATHRG